MGKSMTKKRQQALPKYQRPAPRVKSPTSVEHNSFWPIPDLTQCDMAFGNIKHLPAYSAIPDRFTHSSDPYVRFVSGWFSAAERRTI